MENHLTSMQKELNICAMMCNNEIKENRQMTNDLRNEIASCLHEFGKGCSETGSGNPANCRHCTQATADAILAKLEPDALIVAALERSAGYISRAIDCVTSGTYDQSDPRIEQLCEYADAIRALAVDPEARAAIKAKAGWSE